MHPLLRLTLAIIAGIVISFFVIVLFEGLNAKLYPSKILHPTIQEIILEMKGLPIQAFLIVLLGYILSSFMGGYLAARIAYDKHKLYAGLTVGFVLLLGGIVNFVSIPHPLWVSISACLSFILFAYLGSRMAIR